MLLLKKELMLVVVKLKMSGMFSWDCGGESINIKSKVLFKVIY